MRLLTFAMATAGLFATQATAQSAPSVPVKNDWFDYQIRWTEGAPSYSAKWMVLTRNGMIVLCGSGYHQGGKRSSNRKILKDLALFVGDNMVAKNVDFFTSVEQRKGLVGSKATCRSTGQKASKYRSRSASLRPTRPHRKY